MSEKLTRKYGLLTAICMVVGIVIGSGVFFKAQDILKLTQGNMPMGILAWLIGGVIMLTCLLTFSFMAQKYSRVNGLVDYAEATVGPGFGYFMGWFCTTMYFPAMSAILAWLSARYTLVFITSANPGFPLLISAAEGGCIVGPECIALALFYLCLLYAMNALAPRLAGKFQTGTTVIKMIPLALMAVVGVIYGLVSGVLRDNMTAQTVTAAAEAAAPAATGIFDQLRAIPLFAAVCATSFAYEGWIIATSINAEIKDSRKNLPRALVVGGIVIVAVYLFYYIGVAGGASTRELMDKGATTAFTNIFGGFLGNVLNLFIAISCLGTANGLMLGCTRCMYSLADRGNGPAPRVFSQVDPKTNMPTNSGVFALAATAVWFLYFYLSNLAGTWSGAFVFDPSELPIVTVYMMYFPIILMWMVKARDQNVLRRFILPILALFGSAFMVFACVVSHREACLWYLLVFAVVMGIGMCFYRRKK